MFKKIPLTALVLALACISALQALAGPPGPGPGPSKGKGPPDPPRDTPGLDPVTLSVLATGGVAGYQYLKNRSSKPQK